jgi:hypothetical protein
MKKFFVTLFILLALGGVIFFFGWAQLKVPAGAYGVIISKTHGVDPHLVRSGEFRWVWYKLIPTNAQIVVFRLDPENYAVNIKNTLPSGNSYASFAGINADFSWELDASISFSLNPDSLVSLLAEKNINSQEALDAYKRDMAEKIEILILRRLISGEDSLQLEEVLTGGSSAEMEREIRNQFPQAGDFSFVVKSARIPDFVLYQQLRLIYVDYIMKQREYISTALGQQAENRINTQLHFDELERYGRLLTQYPVLLEYLAMEKEK